VPYDIPRHVPVDRAPATTRTQTATEMTPLRKETGPKIAVMCPVSPGSWPYHVEPRESPHRRRAALYTYLYSTDAVERSLAMPTLTMEQARAALTRLPEQLMTDHDEAALIVTRRGKPVLAVMAWETYETMVETLEILNDPEQAAQLRQGLQDIANGQSRSWDDIKAKRGL